MAESLHKGKPERIDFNNLKNFKISVNISPNFFQAALLSIHLPIY